VYEALITCRNTAWTGWLLDRMERLHGCAVGAGHPAGRDLVQSSSRGRAGDTSGLTGKG
jgi:hypothetical protein